MGNCITGGCVYVAVDGVMSLNRRSTPKPNHQAEFKWNILSTQLDALQQNTATRAEIISERIRITNIEKLVRELIAEKDKKELSELTFTREHTPALSLEPQQATSVSCTSDSHIPSVSTPLPSCRITVQ